MGISSGRLVIRKLMAFLFLLPTLLMAQSGIGGGSVRNLTSPNFAGNISPYLMPHWVACTAKVKINAGNCRVYAVGDSTTYGDYSTNTSDTGDITVLSWPTLLAKQLNSTLMPANRDSVMGAANGLAPEFGNDARLVIGSGWTALNSPSTGGLLYSASAATASLAFTPTGQVNQFKLWYVTNNGGIGTYAVDAGGTTTFSSGGAAGLTSVTIAAGAVGSHTLNLNWSSGAAIYVVGIEASNTTVGSIQVTNCGIGGAGAGTVAGISYASAVAPWSPLNAVPTQAPDVVLIDLGINNWQGANSTSVAVFTTNLQAMITAWKATSDVILTPGPPSSISVVALATQQQYITAMYQLAITNQIPIIDLFDRWGSYERANIAPFLFYGHILHPNGPGYSDFAQAISTQLLSVIGGK